MKAWIARLRRKVWLLSAESVAWLVVGGALAFNGVFSWGAGGWIAFGFCCFGLAVTVFEWTESFWDLRLLKMADRVQGGEGL